MHKLITAALLATTIASPLLAQENPGNRGLNPYGRDARQQDRGHQPGPDGRPDFHGQPGGGYDARRAPPPQGGGRPDFQRGPGNDGDHRGYDRGFPGGGPNYGGPGADRGPDRGPGWDRGDRGPDRGPPPGGWRDGRGPNPGGDRGAGRHDQRGWDQRWRADNRYDWRGYRAGHRDEFQVPGYYAPGGYGYRRFDPGYRIDAQFYDRRYWILDPYEYRLPPAYGPYRWVRYFDDVLLIDLRTGLVVDSVPGFFY